MYFRQLLNDETACASYLVTDHTRADEPWLISTIGFERAHNRALGHDSEEAFVAALLDDIPPVPARQAEIVAANRSGRPLSVTP